MKKILYLNFLFIIVISVHSLTPEEFLNAAKQKNENNAIQSYDVLLTMTVHDKPIVDEKSISEKVERHLSRQNVKKDDPQYSDFYAKAIDLFTNKNNKRVYKDLISSNKDYVSVSVAQYWNDSEIDLNNIFYQRTTLYNFSRGLNFHISHPGKNILMTKEKFSAENASLDIMLCPEKLLLPYCIGLSNQKTTAEDLTNKNHENELRYKYSMLPNVFLECSVMENDGVLLLTGIKLIGKEKIIEEYKFYSFEKAGPLDTHIAKNMEHIRYSMQNNEIERSMIYEIDKYQLNIEYPPFLDLINAKDGYHVETQKNGKSVEVFLITKEKRITNADLDVWTK